MKKYYILPILFLSAVNFSAFGMEDSYEEATLCVIEGGRTISDILAQDELTNKDINVLNALTLQPEIPQLKTKRLEKNKFNGKNTYAKPEKIKFELECMDNNQACRVNLYDKEAMEAYGLDAGDRIYSTKAISAVEIGYETPIKRYEFNNPNSKKVLVKTVASKDPKKPLELALNNPSGKYIPVGGAYGKLAKMVGTAITKSGIPYNNVISKEDIIEREML